MLRHVSMIILLSMGIHTTQASAEVRKVIVPWNPIHQPASFGDLLNDCANNDVCVKAADAIGAVAGLPPGTISESVETAKKLGFRFNGHQAGDEWRTNVFAPRNFRICDAQVRVISAAPVGVRRSPTFAATIQSNTHFELYSFVHRQGITGGRSWVEAVATIRFARIGSEDEANCYAASGAVYQYRCSQHHGANCGLSKYGTMPRVR